MFLLSFKLFQFEKNDIKYEYYLINLLSILNMILKNLKIVKFLSHSYLFFQIDILIVHHGIREKNMGFHIFYKSF